MYSAPQISNPKNRNYLQGPRRSTALITRRHRRTFGDTGQQIETTVLSKGAGAAASYGASAGLTAAGAGGGALLGTVVPIVGTAVGLLIGGLLSGHFAREAGAKNENAVLNGIIPAILNDIKSIASAYSAGTISASDAVNACETVRQNFWTAVKPYETGPGQHAIACASQSVTLAGGSQKSGASNVTPYTPCDKNCTASCCVGCNWINQWITSAEQVFNAGGGTIQFGTIPGNGYGLQTFSSGPITVTAPAPGAVSSATSALSSNIGGIPLWAIIAAGVGAFLLFR